MLRYALIVVCAAALLPTAHAYKVRKECEEVPTKQGAKTRCKSVYDAEATERWREEKRMEREAAKEAARQQEAKNAKGKK